MRMYNIESLWNKPTADQHYMMQIACEVRRSAAQNPHLVRLGDFKIPFTSILVSPSGTVIREEGQQGTTLSSVLSNYGISLPENATEEEVRQARKQMSSRTKAGFDTGNAKEQVLTPAQMEKYKEEREERHRKERSLVGDGMPPTRYR